MSDKIYNVLFLCTHNSARSILSEGLLNQIGQGRFKAYSAGSMPSGKVNPFALATLEKLGIDTTGMRSKTWDEFAEAGAPQMDFIFTVCDNAAGEVCPIWPGHPTTAHWGFADPSATEGDDAAKLAAFAHTASLISNRLRLFTSLPIDKLDKLALKAELQRLAQS
ncbi:arsenate reductase ArsC [Chitinimonas sp. BJYL2]|uniref:arsenate reductase ArsC n=1 Tax=Chitinimonas sp. BJYL2 TaxID=2976696 RepID=UPI0022B48202|nr:arsenate reductase ArsC [Chitinimonas sp. BJYL2]